ncbi:MAG: response regulator [Thermoleophilia bacterium]|nr:response regulator [Thermoleophilia bacterium]
MTSHATAGPGDDRHVLVVDDEDDVREVVSTTLRLLAGWRVTEASSGEEALMLAAADVPDAVLLDVMMPGMSGSEVFDRLREQEATRDVPVIMMTARAGFDAANIISKPFDPLMLPDRIRKILEVAALANPNAEQLHNTEASLGTAWSRRRNEVIERVRALGEQLEPATYYHLSEHARRQIVEDLHGMIGVAGAFGFDEAARIGRLAHDIATSQLHQPLDEIELAHLCKLASEMVAAFFARPE